ncbi:MAG TPA: DUF4160 domain-containing protein [Planctomycetota bacterium]|nr:DUF4160 domain-containing protein [Planctomycetota bacterium]
MPEISRFFGIIIRMRYNDNAPPHFHVHSGGATATIALRPLRILEGELPPRALGLVIEWAALHQEELLLDWNLARAQLPLRKVAPLV